LPLLAALAAGLLGCAPTPPAAPVTPPDPCAGVMTQDAAAALQTARRAGSAEVQRACLATWLDGHAGAGIALGELALTAIREASDTKDLCPLALVAAQRGPAGAERAYVEAAIGEAAIDKGRLDVAEAALADVLGPGSGAAEGLVYEARLHRARLRAVQGRVADAEKELGALIDEDAAAIAPVRALIGLWRPPDKSNLDRWDVATLRVDGLCTALLGKERAAQTLACVQAAGDLLPGGPVGAVYFVFHAYALFPGLSMDDVQRLRGEHPDLRWALEAALACASGARSGDVALKGDSSGNWDISAFYVRLADGAGRGDPRKAACFLSVAAESCLSTLAHHGDCRDVGALARYANALPAVAPKQLSGFIDRIIKRKDQEYEYLQTQTVAAKRTLFQMHLALAQILSEPGRQNPGVKVMTVAYHVGRMRDFWKALHPDAPDLPTRLLKGIRTGTPGPH
jgi:hypothetical protein